MAIYMAVRSSYSGWHYCVYCQPVQMLRPKESAEKDIALANPVVFCRNSRVLSFGAKFYLYLRRLS